MRPQILPTVTKETIEDANIHALIDTDEDNSKSFSRFVTEQPAMFRHSLGFAEEILPVVGVIGRNSVLAAAWTTYELLNRQAEIERAKIRQGVNDET
jgi:hypothetical protein